MEFLISLLPTFAHLGHFGYWLVLLFSFAESLAFVGVFIPGTVFIIVAGFFSSQGYLDLGDLILFATAGAIVGDGLSYWLGTKGTGLFRYENKLLKLEHLEKGESFFKKHGGKSVFLGRFLGPLRSVVPFIAGISKMKLPSFLLWNVTSGFLWAALYTMLGYFFGGTIHVVEKWPSRAGSIAVIAIVSIVVLWVILKKARPFFLLLHSLWRSFKKAIVENPDMTALAARHPHFFGFVRQRLYTGKFSGLPLTLLALAFLYVLFLFVGIVEDIMVLDPIVAIDTRLANILFSLRMPELILFFLWVTLLGKWQIVLGGALVASLLLWLWQKRFYIAPLWITIIGSEIFHVFGKLATHRLRPELSYYMEHGFSFPSGHATIAMAFYGFLTYVLFREVSEWGRKFSVVFWGLVVILSIGGSRLYLGVHYLSDVWGGYLSGLLVLIVGVALSEWTRTKSPEILPASVPSRVKFISAFLILLWIALFATFGLYWVPAFQ